MEKYTQLYRPLFLRICLFAMVCQTGNLFSQGEMTSGTNWDGNTPSFEGENVFSTQNFPQPQNGQWPVSSSNNWENQPFSSEYWQTDDQSYESIQNENSDQSFNSNAAWNDSPTSFVNFQEDSTSCEAYPQNSEWPVYSHSEWTNEPTLSSESIEPPDFVDFQGNRWPADYNNDFDWKNCDSNDFQRDSKIDPTRQTSPSESFTNDETTYSLKDNFECSSEKNSDVSNLSNSSLRNNLKKSDAEKQNYRVFDLTDDENRAQKQQYPYTKEGAPASYPFDNNKSNASDKEPSSIDEHSQEIQDSESKAKSSSEKEDIADSSEDEIALLSSLKTSAGIKEDEKVPSLELISQTVSSTKTSVQEKPRLTAQLLNPNFNPSPAQRNSSPVIQGNNNATNRQNTQSLKEISINFNNVAIIEYIRFISRISNKNFVFDDEDLQFNVTIVSEEPTSVENLMAALLQELKIRDLSLIEQGNNIIIHRNTRVRAPSRIVVDGTEPETTHDSELVTRVFRLNTLDPVKVSEIIRPLLSEDALIEVLRDTNNLIITDLVTNVNKIGQLIRNLDSPNSGVTIGQYVVRNTFVASLVDLATKILQPIAQGNPFVLVPHPVSNSIFIVSNSFIVEKALAILQNLDSNEGRTKILSLDTLHLRNPDGTLKLGGNTGQGGPNGQVPEGGLGLGGQGGQQGQGGVGGLGLNGQGGPGYGPGGQQGQGGLGGQQGGIGPGGQQGQGGAGGLGLNGQGGFGGLGQEGEGAGGGLGLGGGAYGPYGEYGGNGQGYGPNGQFGNHEAIPRSFPFGGIGSDGRIHPENGQYGILRSEGRNNVPGERYPFLPGGIGTEGRPSAIFDESRDFLPGSIGASSRWSNELPVGHIERTLFFIYKLRYRKGDQIEIALRKIATSLQLMGTANADLISAINSSQWIESSNSLIFTGTALSLDKVRELILEVDVPLRQVFIEMLILNTSIDDSLTYGVDWVDRFGGGNTTGEEGFIGLSGLSTLVESLPGALPVASGVLGAGLGYNAAIIGTHLTHNGTQYNTIGALVRAVHTDAKTDIIMNPKIITEDNNTAEIFVGGTDRYKTQSITNELGNLVTNNFQFIDVGTTLRVTPLIGNNGIITLDIIQETTNGDSTANSSTPNQLVVDVNLVPVLTKTRTVTKVHVPDGFFVVLSGMIQDTEIRSITRIPCLGGIPILGTFGKTQSTVDSKRNLMIFIRPLIVNNEDDIESLTKRKQDEYREKSKFRRSWNYEIDEALNFANIKPTDRDEIGCDQ